MNNFIILVKQVPDVTKIGDDCFNHETGTLIRAKLPSVLNDLDRQALSLASHMRHLQGGEGLLILLSMGPPMAEEVLRFGLKRGGDAAILLTDKAFGGADTVATANPLAGAIRRIARDFFADRQDYYVVCGMQSVDGDTAQVPPQLAEDLNVPCLTYVTGVDCEQGQFAFTHIVAGGNQVTAPRRLPAVLTVAKYETPLFATFAANRKATRTPVVKWGKDDITATLLGLEGSKTSVYRVFQPDKSQRQCVALHNPAEMAQTIVDVFSRSETDAGAKKTAAEDYILPAKRRSLWVRNCEGGPRDTESVAFLEGLLNELALPLDRELTVAEKEMVLLKANKRFAKNALDDLLAGIRLAEPSFPGEVWVMAEHDQGRLHGATHELLGKARELARTLETRTGVLLLGGQETDALPPELFAAGADTVYLLQHELLAVFDPAAWRQAVAEAVRHYRPGILLFGATTQGRTLAPLVSYRTGNGLTADCTSFAIHDFTSRRKNALLYQTRPALGGNIMATIFTKNSTTQMATARPGVFKRLAPDPSRHGELVRVPVAVSEADLSWRILRREVAGKTVNFHAEVIVSGGKGVRSKANYHELMASLMTSLAKRLGTPVEKGASRAAVEHGFVERAYQVGQTGTAVSPKIYLALGISGAIQHMIGIANTKTIFAINSDPHAPIFKQCDYYLVGNVDDLVPELVKALEAGK